MCVFPTVQIYYHNCELAPAMVVSCVSSDKTLLLFFNLHLIYYI